MWRPVPAFHLVVGAPHMPSVEPPIVVDSPLPTTPSSELPSIEPTPIGWRLGLAAVVLVIAATVYFGREAIGHSIRAGLGVIAFIATVAACSMNLRAVRWRTIAWGVALQAIFALIILKTSYGARFFQEVGHVVEKFLGFTNAGSSFVFGKLADPATVESAFGKGSGFLFAFQALPTIIFVSSFFTVLYYFGVLQFIVRVMAKAMMYMMATSGAESLSAVANVFMGQTEAPLIVKPYVPRMTRSELLAMMVGGMATISGGVMAMYIAMGADAVAILATSVMAAPCGLYLSKLMLPEMQEPETSGKADIKSEQMHSNAIDAAAGGASDGMHLAFNVAAMIIAFLAFISLINYVLGLLYPGFSLTTIFSTLFYPVALMMGCDVKDAPMLADLLGTKLVTNEFVAYYELTKGKYAGVISHNGLVLATYALTGFANIASIGIQLGGIGSLAPTRRADLAALGGRALLCGFLATLINASIAGILMR
jgi:CNT family concentrative nucleoside transporter